MTQHIIIAGSGGQGIMLLGKILAMAAMKENKNVTWLPSYGAEVRGGTAHCMVVISEEEIGSPYVEKADTLIIMNAPSLERFRDRKKATGQLIVNSSLVPLGANTGRVQGHPFTDIAIRLGNIKVANMVALGFYAAQKKIVSLQSIKETFSCIAPEAKRELIEINKTALEEGAKLK